MPLSTLALNIRIGGCPNICRHCWAMGSQGKPVMTVADTLIVLDQLVGARRDLGVDVHLFLLDEPTHHPGFDNIAEHIAARDLWGPGSFMATNGAGLAHADAGRWKAIGQAGLEYLQLTFYGVRETHDRFAGRRGAFDDLIQTAATANAYGIGWEAGILLHRWNLSQVEAVRQQVADLHPRGRRPGVFLPSSQGRMTERLRPCKTALERAGVSPSGRWRSEKDHIAHLLSSPQHAEMPAFDPICPLLVLEVDSGLSVYAGGGCDSGGLLAVVPGIRSELLLGNLTNESLATIVNRYISGPPGPVRRLAAVTRGQLAMMYGNE